MKSKIMSEISFYWGVFGVIYILVKTILNLCIYVNEAFTYAFELHHWITLVLFTIFMGYSEGYKGFQLKFSPRIISRAIYLKNNLTPVRFVLAPLFCMGYFYGTKKRLITSYAVTAGVAILVISVKQLAQPWRGIIDVGVVFGLSWGTLAIVCFLIQFLKTQKFDVSPETPDQP